MAEKITIKVLTKSDYLRNPIEIGLDKGWSSKSAGFDQRLKSQGVYIFHVSALPRIIYVGKTRGPTMDFATRLYRHATGPASGDSKVYRALKKAESESGGPVLVSLVTTEQIRSLFEGQRLKDDAMVDIYEQVLIHLLEPEIQQ